MRVRRLLRRVIVDYCIGSIVLAILLAELAFHPQGITGVDATRARAVLDQVGARLQEAAVVPADGVRLDAWFALPQRTNGDAVILLHGVGDSRQGMIHFASLFAARGYSVLMPDSRGHGTSGGVTTYGVREAGDLGFWYRWLRAHGCSGCVFGLGESMGAAILLQALPGVPFCAVVAESPFAGFRQIAYVRVGQLFGAGSWVGETALRPSVELAFLYGRVTRGVRLTDASPETSVVAARVPVLLIHGLADSNIPIGQSEMILARNPEAVTLWRVPNAGHCGASQAAGSEFEQRVVGWFASHRLHGTQHGGSIMRGGR